MAKVPFTKLKLKVNEDSIPLKIGDETIAIKQYLPIQEKLSLIGRIVELAHMQDYNYSNPVKAKAMQDLEIIFTYTNLSFTDKQKEDTAKLYDMLYSSGVLQQILENIPKEEYSIIDKGVNDTITAVYQYINSVVGMLDTISHSQKDAVVDLETLQSGIENLQNSAILKDLMPLFGLE